MYKNIIKLDYEEKPDYPLYILLLKAILKNINVEVDDNYEFHFYRKYISFMQNKKLEDIKKELYFKDINIFESYLLKIIGLEKHAYNN